MFCGSTLARSLACELLVTSVSNSQTDSTVNGERLLHQPALSWTEAMEGIFNKSMNNKMLNNQL